MRLRAAGLFVVVWLATPLVAEPLSITTVARGDAPDPVSKARLSARRIDGRGQPVERWIDVPGTESLDLDAGNWQVSIESPHYWSAPVIAQTGRPAVIELWPMGSVSAKAKTAPRGDELQELRVVFEPALENPAPGAPAGEAHCSVANNLWHCAVPAGTWDLRFVSKGFATEFRWNRQVHRRKDLNLGVLRFRSGASLSGFVGAARGSGVAIEGGLVIAQPHSVTGDGSPRRYTAFANGRGFFQIAGLPPGEYRVHAESKEFRSEDRPVTVLADLNAELRSPLILEKPVTLTIQVGPVAGRRWHFRLHRRLSDGQIEQGAEAVTSAEGQWVGAVVPGRYILHVGPGGDAVWSSTDVTVDAEDVEVRLSIPAVRIVGTVKLGDRPLARARLLFGGNQALRQETLVTGSDGEFAGELPARESGEVDWKISIEADAPYVRRTATYAAHRDDNGELRLDIDLPATVVKGRVVNEDKSAEPGAVVTLRSPDGSVFEQAFAATDGSFELMGFDPGRYRVQAHGFERSSEILDIEAGDEATIPLEIVLRNDVVVRGRVRARNTAGVEAKLTALQRGVRTNFIPASTSDPEGFFELRLPPGTRMFDLLVQAPGFAMAGGRVEIREDKFLNLTIEQIGGSLSLEIPSGVDPVLLHDGGEYPARWLSELAGAAVERGENWQTARLANVEAGAYSLCASGRCVSGTVAPNGTLTLSLRSGG